MDVPCLSPVKRVLRLSVGVLAGCALLLVAVLVLGWALGDHERLFRGKPISYWRQQLDKGASPQAITVAHTLVIPYLTNQMFGETNDWRYRAALVDRLNELPGRTIYFTPAPGRRIRAVHELADFGTNALAATPALFQALKDELLCGAAADALVKVGADPEKVIPALLECVVGPDGHGRADVVEALGEYGPKAKAATPVLIKLLDDHSSKDLMEATPEALRKIAPEAAAKAGVSSR